MLLTTYMLLALAVVSKAFYADPTDFQVGPLTILGSPGSSQGAEPGLTQLEAPSYTAADIQMATHPLAFDGGQPRANGRRLDNFQNRRNTDRRTSVLTKGSAATPDNISSPRNLPRKRNINMSGNVHMLGNISSRSSGRRQSNAARSRYMQVPGNSLRQRNAPRKVRMPGNSLRQPNSPRKVRMPDNMRRPRNERNNAMRPPGTLGRVPRPGMTRTAPEKGNIQSYVRRNIRRPATIQTTGYASALMNEPSSNNHGRSLYLREGNNRMTDTKSPPGLTYGDITWNTAGNIQKQSARRNQMMSEASQTRYVLERPPQTQRRLQPMVEPVREYNARRSRMMQPVRQTQSHARSEKSHGGQLSIQSPVHQSVIEEALTLLDPNGQFTGIDAALGNYATQSGTDGPITVLYLDGNGHQMISRPTNQAHSLGPFLPIGGQAYPQVAMAKGYPILSASLHNSHLAATHFVQRGHVSQLPPQIFIIDGNRGMVGASSFDSIRGANNPSLFIPVAAGAATSAAVTGPLAPQTAAVPSVDAAAPRPGPAPTQPAQRPAVETTIKKKTQPAAEITEPVDADYKQFAAIARSTPEEFNRIYERMLRMQMLSELEIPAGFAMNKVSGASKPPTAVSSIPLAAHPLTPGHAMDMFDMQMFDMLI